MSTMLMPLQFHVSSCSVSSSLSVVIQNTSTILQALLVIYCFEHITFLHCSQNCLLFRPPRLFILHFRMVLFLCPAFFFTLSFTKGLPPLIFYPLSAHHYLHSSPFICLKFQRSMANRIHSLNYTPEEPPPLLFLSSNHCCSLIPYVVFFFTLSLLCWLLLHTYCTYIILPCFQSLGLSLNRALLHGHLSLSYCRFHSLLTHSVHH